MVYEQSYVAPIGMKFICDRWLCLLTKFCLDDDLNVLHQRQPNKCFNEAAARYVHTTTLIIYKNILYDYTNC